MMYSLDEVGLIPSATSSIEHRADINPFYGDKLPIFVAPMTCLINLDNWKTFKDSKVIPIWPVRDANNPDREIPSKFGPYWMAVTVDEFRSWFNAHKVDKYVPKDYYKILIDCANGNMEELFSLVKDAKNKYGDILVVMIGNVANPATYLECCRAGVDYVRVGIGGGSGCTTSVQTGIHASLPWILKGIKKIKRDYYYIPVNGHPSLACFENYLKHHNWTMTKIVADGGITNPSRAIKCLALGADYVMMGKAFAGCEEVADFQTTKYERESHNEDYLKKTLYYGQSSELGQMDRFGKVKASPEGTHLWVPVTTTLKGFTDKFEAALRSAMSYCGAKTLKDFIGKVQYEYMSPDEFRAYNK